jgi:lipoprotein-anchoring transpeptidase ErfK/SrfK
MDDGNGTGRRHRRVMTGVIGLAAAALMLVGCSSTSTGTPTSTGGNGGSGAGSGASGQTSTVADAVVSITPASTGGSVNPATPIVVKATGGTLTSVTVTNTAKGTRVSGDLSADRTTWTSNIHMGFGATYSVTAVSQNSAGKTTTQQSTISTISAAKLAYANMIPGPTIVKSTGIGVGQPVVFQFKYPVKNKKAVQDALSVSTTPSQPGAWYWISATQVDYRAQTFWQAGTTINVNAKIYGLDFGNGVYGAEDRQVTYHVHDAWIAKADGHTHQMGIYDNGRLVKTMNISMGRPTLPTHSGIHVIQSKAQSVQMNSCSYGVCSGPNAYNETEYWAERISNTGEFVHENPDTVGSQGSSNVSHGCINLNAADAQWFFNHFNIGDVVEVTNSGGPTLPIWDMYGDWTVSWAKWSAGNA